MPETVTYKELNKQFDNQVKTCDVKLTKESKYRHDLANNITARFVQLEDHIETNNSKMLDKIEKILLCVTKNQGATKTLSEWYNSLWKEFKEHMRVEELDRKDLLKKMDYASNSRVSKTLFTWAVAALVVVLWFWAWLISYILLSNLAIEKSMIKIEENSKYHAERISTIEELLSSAEITK